MPRPTTSAVPSETQSYSAQEVSEAALKGFFHLAERWRLDTREQLALLGQPPRSTFFAWKKGTKAVLSQDTLERISYLLGIWKALRILIPDDRQAKDWVKKPNGNPLFDGGAPIERMTRGRIMDLADVRRLLDARRGVW